MVDREEDDTVEYKNKATWVFNQAKSAPGLTEDVVLVFPHVMILSMILATVREKPAMVGLAGKLLIVTFQKLFYNNLEVLCYDESMKRITIYEYLLVDSTFDCFIFRERNFSYCFFVKPLLEVSSLKLLD